MMGRMPRRGFSMIELLTVVAIVALLLGLGLILPRADEREAHVRGAANELAAVLRATRALAMEKRQMHAVAFNIGNAPGTSGLVLNNRSGGHWYRVLGPGNELGKGWQHLGDGYIPLYNRELSSFNGASCGMEHQNTDSPVRYFLESMERSWIGDRRVLPPGKVRFLALTDQDNGDYRLQGDTYAPTYPRPWFGWWDPASQRLHPWGGYDPDLAMTTQTASNSRHKARIRNGRTISHSGFHYEGYDGPIVGCVNPSDRLIVDDTNANGVINSGTADLTTFYRLWRDGEPRPLINGQWGDYLIVFRPDGTVTTDWMRLRHECARDYLSTNYMLYDPSLGTTNGDAVPTSGKLHFMQLGPGDLCNRLGKSDGYPGIMDATGREGSSFTSHSGFSFVTLAPDVSTDTDRFPTAQAAMHTLNPLYRVGVSPFGEVVVIKVRTTNHLNRTFDTALTGADWNNKAKTDRYYYQHRLANPTDAASGTRESQARRGEAIIDVVTTDMLSGRIWWWQ